MNEGVILMTPDELFDFIEKEHKEEGIPYKTIAKRIGIADSYLYYLRSRKELITKPVIAKIEAYIQSKNTQN